MALHTRKQFAELIGLEFNKDGRAKIATWIKRGNIIVADDFIDDTNQQNIYWIKKQQEKAPPVSVKVDPLKEVPAMNPEPSAPVTEKKPKKDKKDPDNEKWNLDVEKKSLEIEKLKVDTRLQELKEDKIRGEVIPILLAKQIVSTLSQSFITSQKDGIEYLLISFAKESKLSGEQLAKLRGRMVEILNDGADKAIAVAKRNMKSLVEEFSIKKEIGEHE